MLDRLDLARTLVTILVLVLGTALVFRFGDQSPVLAAVAGLFGLVLGWWFPSDGQHAVPQLTIMTDKDLGAWALPEVGTGLVRAEDQPPSHEGKEGS